MFTSILTHRGMRVLASDLLEARRKLARRAGAWRTFDAADPNLVDQLRRASGGRGVDAAVIAVPVDAAVHQAQEALRGGGTVLLFAHTVRGQQSPMDLGRICVDEKALTGSYSSDFRLQGPVAKLVFSRALDVRRWITHRFPLEQTAAAIDLAARPTPESLKVMISVEAGR
jgi:L-iditol 2-dehydrogenase